MKWVRRNSLQKPAHPPLRWNEEIRRYERIPADEVKPYRMYSKWHILHETKSGLYPGGMVVSLCGQFKARSQDVETRDTEPTSGTRSYRTQKVTCYYCRIVAESNA